MPKTGRLLAIDPGSKTLGLAITDVSQMMAHPLRTVKRSKWTQDREQLSKVIEEQQVVGIVMGYPRNADGSEGPACQAVRALVRNLEALTDLPILLQDERFTTSEAEAALIGRNTKQSGRLDAAAAAIILEDYLRGR